MKHYLLEMGTDESAIDAERKRISKNGQRPIGSHECIIIMTFNHMKKKIGYEGSREFNTSIQTLKTYRVNSDYKNEDFPPRHGHESVALCDKINKFILNML
jgi:hypothetical protein